MLKLAERNLGFCLDAGSDMQCVILTFLFYLPCFVVYNAQVIKLIFIDDRSRLGPLYIYFKLCVYSKTELKVDWLSSHVNGPITCSDTIDKWIKRSIWPDDKSCFLQKMLF